MSFDMISQYIILENGIIYSGDLMKPLKARISITVDYPILEKIKEQAEYPDRSVSSYINLVMKKHFEQLEQKLK